MGESLTGLGIAERTSGAAAVVVQALGDEKKKPEELEMALGMKR